MQFEQATQRRTFLDFWKEIMARREANGDVQRGYDRVRRLYEIGAQVRKRRLDLGLTQRDLASRSKVSVSTLSRLESGEALPRFESLDRLSEVLGTRLVIDLVSRRSAGNAPSESRAAS